jgi:hypothetical protein
MKILSWGLGLQSTALLEMSLSGDYGLPKLDAAIFADTGYEHEYSHEIYDFYAPRAIKAGIKVVKIGDQDILADQYKHVDLPLFILGTDRMIKRKCTRDYKIRPIQRQIRDLLGVKRRGRLSANLVTLWLGITVDEIERAKLSRVAYISHEFPLLDIDFKRGDCADYLKAKNLPVPKKSSCKFCPFQKHSEWADKSEEDIALITDLQTHINDNKLVQIGGQPKLMSFLPNADFIQADFLIGGQAEMVEQAAMCDGGFCHS